MGFVLRACGPMLRTLAFASFYKQLMELMMIKMNNSVVCAIQEDSLL
jgi:hypothetical protein